jgi:antitoxin (DNA-binding transcriptional repressor) of toxin-antitoxin stability system
MKSVEISNQTGSVAELLKLAKEQSGLLLLESGRPVARIIPLPQLPPDRVAPLHPGAIDVTSDFDASLPDEFWLGRP